MRRWWLQRRLRRARARHAMLQESHAVTRAPLGSPQEQISYMATLSAQATVWELEWELDRMNAGSGELRTVERRNR